MVDRRLSDELLKVISRFGVEASLRAIEELSAGDAAQRAALSSKREQLEYEVKKAFEQYDAVDARNRLAAAELERRWNERLEEIQTVKERLSSLYEKRYSLSAEEEARIRLMGENFAEIWHSDRCPPTLKKMIRLCCSPFTGRAVRTRNSTWSGRAQQPRRRRRWRL